MKRSIEITPFPHIFRNSKKISSLGQVVQTEKLDSDSKTFRRLCLIRNKNLNLWKIYRQLGRRGPGLT